MHTISTDIDPCCIEMYSVTMETIPCVQVADFKSDVTVPVDDSTEALTRWDSYENFAKHEGKLTGKTQRVIRN